MENGWSVAHFNFAAITCDGSNPRSAAHVAKAPPRTTVTSTTRPLWKGSENSFRPQGAAKSGSLIMSWLLFSHAAPVLRKAQAAPSGEKQKLEPEDQLPLQPDDCCLSAKQQRFRQDWNLHQEEAKRLGREPELWRVFARNPSMRTLWLKSTLLTLLQLALSFAGPLVLQWVLILTSGVELCSQREFMPGLNGTIAAPRPLAEGSISDACLAPVVRWGYWLAGGLFVTKMVQALAMSHAQMQMLSLGLRIRASLGAALYAKCLRIPPGLNHLPTGKIQALMAKDTELIVGMAPWINVREWEDSVPPATLALLLA